MKVGFTGTQKGLTPQQIAELGVYLRYHITNNNDEFHHGDCIGADAQAHLIVLSLGTLASIHIHPPEDESKQARCEFLLGKVYPRKPYLDRNKDIVDACDILIACPLEYAEELRSGTWSTIRYARKTGKPIVIIYRDGSVKNDWRRK